MIFALAILGVSVTTITVASLVFVERMMRREEELDDPQPDAEGGVRPFRHAYDSCALCGEYSSPSCTALANALEWRCLVCKGTYRTHCKTKVR